MKIVVYDGKVMTTFMDYAPVELGGYPAGTRAHWIPDETPLLATEENSKAIIVDPRINMAIADLKNCVAQDVDFKTDGLIDNGFTYANIVFPAAIEHQMNYKTIYDIRDSLTYPFTVKGKGQNFHQIQDAAEMAQFFWTAFTFVHTTLTGGWQVKGSLDALTIEELLNFVDPRV